METAAWSFPATKHMHPSANTAPCVTFGGPPRRGGRVQHQQTQHHAPVVGERPTNSRHSTCAEQGAQGDRCVSSGLLGSLLPHSSTEMGYHCPRLMCQGRQAWEEPGAQGETERQSEAWPIPVAQTLFCCPHTCSSLLPSALEVHTGEAGAMLLRASGPSFRPDSPKCLCPLCHPAS